MSEEVEGQVTLRAVHESNLKFSKLLFEQGNYLALYDAIIACEAARCEMPSWLATALKEFISLAFTDQLPKKRGRSGNTILEIRTTYVHQIRHIHVSMTREAQKRSQLHILPPRAKRLFAAGIIKRFRRTWEDAYEIAAGGF